VHESRPARRHSEALTFWQRHPILVQIGRDFGQLTWQQIGLPAGTALSATIIQLLNDYLADRLDWRATGETLFYSLALGAMLYLIVAIVRAPFVVIGAQYKRLLELDRRISHLTGQLQVVRPLPELISGLNEAAPRKVTKTVEIDPNIQPLETELFIAHEQEDGIIVEGEIIERYRWAQDSKNLGVLALPFQNRIPENKPIGTADYVVARMVIRSFDSDVVQELNRIAWLSEDSHRVYFEQGDTRKLIILAFEGDADDPQISAIRRDSPGTKRGFQSQRLRLPRPEELLSFTVSLLHEGTSALIRKTEYILELSLKPEFAFTFSRAYFWKREHISTFRHQAHEFVMRFYDVQTEIHEKGKALDNPFDSALLAERNEKEKVIAEELKVWEQDAAAFIGRIFGADEKKKFLELTPSIEAGLGRERKRWFALVRPPTKKDEYVSPNWDLSDSIEARTIKLEGLAETIKF